MTTPNRRMREIVRVGLLTHKLPRPRLPYSLRMLWRDRGRFLPALLAITFSAVLIAVQCGLVMGLVLTTSAPIDHSIAHIWVLAKETPSLHQASTFPRDWQAGPAAGEGSRPGRAGGAAAVGPGRGRA